MRKSKKMYYYFILWSFLFCVFPVFGKEVLKESISLYVGIQYDYKLSKNLKGKKLKFEGTYKRYTGNPQYNMTTGVVRFIPKRTGVGALNIKDSSGRILKKLTLTVGRTNLQQAATEIQSLLRTVDGIQIKILNNKVVVDGEIIVPRDMRRIHNVVREYDGKATSLVTLSPLAQNKVAKFIEKEINDPNITVRATNMVFVLEGFVSSQEEKDRAREITELYLPDRITDRAVTEQKVKEWARVSYLNHIQVRQKKTDERKKLIQLVVHYVELSKDYADSFRFQWTPALAKDETKFSFHSGGGGLGAIGGIISGTISNFLPKLNWAKSFGFARILHSANIITEEEKPAIIESSKQIPAQGSIGASGEQGIMTFNAGVTMTLTPRVVGPRGDSVQLSNVEFKIENVVGTAGQNPIMSKRRLTTSIYVQNGLSAVMGGMISNKTFSDYNREPPNAVKNPVLSFLSSKKFHRSQSQFVVFVTPIIKSSASSGVKRIKKKFKLSSN